MPRTKIDLPYHIDFLSILDAEGNLDETLEPDIPEEILLRIHATMLLGRRFDERLLNLQRQGRIGTFPPITGQEASHVGAVAVLRDSDWMVPSFRETAAEIWRGRKLESVIIANNGFRCPKTAATCRCRFRSAPRCFTRSASGSGSGIEKKTTSL